jgi:hypothetical protein
MKLSFNLAMDKHGEDFCLKSSKILLHTFVYDGADIRCGVVGCRVGLSPTSVADTACQLTGLSGLSTASLVQPHLLCLELFPMHLSACLSAVASIEELEASIRPLSRNYLEVQSIVTQPPP